MVPSGIAVVHVRGYQRGMDYWTHGNNLADAEAQRAAVCLPVFLNNLNKSEDDTKYQKCCISKEIQVMEKLGAKQEGDKWLLPDGREMLSKSYVKRIIHQLH